MTDTILILGSFAFAGYEVPPFMTGGGDQTLAVHKLIGGTRVIDAMGPDPKPISWNGRLQGASAESRMRSLETIRDRGQAVSLTWGTQRKQVFLKTVDWQWDRYYQILYNCVCEVVEDSNSTLAAGGLGLDTPITNLIGKDTLNALGLSDLVGNASLGSAMSDLQGAVSVAGAITGSSKIAAIGGYLSTAQSAAGGLFAVANGNILPGALSLAGIAGRSAGKAFGAQVANMAGVANAGQVQSLLSRVGLNLGRAP